MRNFEGCAILKLPHVSILFFKLLLELFMSARAKNLLKIYIKFLRTVFSNCVLRLNNVQCVATRTFKNTLNS